ncbi:MAG: response regulator [Balneolaceae bacterium]|nr:response regulator [Balneolaceae bacterium]
MMRHIMVKMMREAEGVTLSGAAGFTDEKSAINAIKKQNPDLLLLGVDEMESGEIKLFERLRKVFPKLPVVLITPLSEKGAEIAIFGLRNGAIDFITKPDQRNGLIFASNHFQKRVLPIVKAITRLNLERVAEYNLPKNEKGQQPITSLPNGPERITNYKIGLLSINGCLGAIPSLFNLVSELPANLPVPVVIVQHMPKKYTDELARQLDGVTPLHVREAKNSSLLLPGQVYLAPGGYHSVVRNEGPRRILSLHRGPREHKYRPSIDVFLRSAVNVYNGKVLGVFLSGGGNDGIDGAMEVLNAGGVVMLENNESALLWDMPSKILKLKTGLNQYPAEQISVEIRKNLIPEKEKKITEPLHAKKSQKFTFDIIKTTN